MGDEKTGAGRKPARFWLPVGTLAIARFGVALGVVIGDGRSTSTTPTAVLGTQFVRDTTTTLAASPPSTDSVTVPATTASTVNRAAATTTTLASKTTGSTIPTSSTSGTLPPRPDCGTGNAQATVNVAVTPITTEVETTTPPTTSSTDANVGPSNRVTKSWAVVGTVVVASTASKPIQIDGLTIQFVRDGASPQDVPLLSAPGIVVAPGASKTFEIELHTDTRPSAVRIARFAYHTAGLPACASA